MCQRFAGASGTVACAPSARFVFDFPSPDATVARDGDDLNIGFEDGSKLQPVENVDVLLKGVNAASLTSLEDLATRYGLSPQKARTARSGWWTPTASGGGMVLPWTA